MRGRGPAIKELQQSQAPKSLERRQHPARHPRNIARFNRAKLRRAWRAVARAPSRARASLLQQSQAPKSLERKFREILSRILEEVWLQQSQAPKSLESRGHGLVAGALRAASTEPSSEELGESRAQNSNQFFNSLQQSQAPKSLESHSRGERYTPVEKLQQSQAPKSLERGKKAAFSSPMQRFNRAKLRRAWREGHLCPARHARREVASTEPSSEELGEIASRRRVNPRTGASTEPSSEELGESLLMEADQWETEGFNRAKLRRAWRGVVT